MKSLKPVTIHSVSGSDILPFLGDAARLRIAVFREFPYLYDGDLAYERKYLESYAASDHSLMVLALDGDEVVGVSTAMAMEDAAESFRRPFEGESTPINEILYFGESVLLDKWRGRGIGHRFFDERERHALSIKRRFNAFCAVIRELDHPARPRTYRPLDGFWTRRGYHPLHGKTCELDWKSVTSGKEETHTLQFWGKHAG